MEQLHTQQQAAQQQRSADRARRWATQRLQAAREASCWRAVLYSAQLSWAGYQRWRATAPPALVLVLGSLEGAAREGAAESAVEVARQGLSRMPVPWRR
jgi:hypothetical protein